MTRFRRMGMGIVRVILTILTNILSELPSDYKGVMRKTYGREVYYDIPDPKLRQATQWLIGNPNRVNLGRIGLRYQGSTLNETFITESKQILDLWDGTITSTFKVNGEEVTVVTQGDFESDAVAFTIESDLIKSGDLQVELDFPYPPIHTTEYKYEVGSDCDVYVNRMLISFAGLCWFVRLPNEPQYYAHRGWVQRNFGAH